MKKKFIQFMPIHIACILIAYVLVMLIIIGQVNGLGIAPSLKIINYDTAEHTITVNAVNTKAGDLTLQITAGGELAQYITLDNNVIHLSSADSEKSFQYNIKLPADMDPGIKTGLITVTEINSGGENGDNVNAALSVAHKLQVNVPSTGLHATAFLSNSESEINSPMTISISINNVGTDTIRDAYGIINISSYDFSYENTTEHTHNIFPGGSRKIDYTWIPKVSPGDYVITAKIYYDNKSIVLNKSVSIGDYGIEIINANVKDFYIGTIAKLDINVSNNWNNPIATNTEVQLLDQSGTIIKQATVNGAAIDPTGGIVSTYIDTTGISVGDYTLKIMMRYGSKIIEKTYPTKIGTNKIVIETIAKNIQPTQHNYTGITLGVLAIVIIAIIALILFSTKGKKKTLRKKGQGRIEN